MPEDKGNGRIELHTYQINDIMEALKAINIKLDKLVVDNAAIKVRLDSVEGWRTWATGIGTAIILTLLGIVLKVAGL